MDNITKYLNKVAYKFPKGYPDISNPEEKAMLFEMVNNLIKEEEADGVVSKEEIIKWAKDNMANYKVPREIEFLDSLPVNAAGKIMKFKLR